VLDVHIARNQRRLPDPRALARVASTLATPHCAGAIPGRIAQVATVNGSIPATPHPAGKRRNATKVVKPSQLGFYTPYTRKIFVDEKDRYCAFVLTNDAYPSQDVRLEQGAKAWRDAKAANPERAQLGMLERPYYLFSC
jgi:hypothetical protein